MNTGGRSTCGSAEQTSPHTFTSMPVRLMLLLELAQAYLDAPTLDLTGFNFFVQLQGRKRFMLFPPASRVAMFPCTHPHMGHAQSRPSSPGCDIDLSSKVIKDVKRLAMADCFV